ncbi:tyrosine-type recombinase/integrase [Priestia aryabhattai]|uniref:tyrosine-type recombinase/integrase n=1 Tax=Priestia aryabhattai TaxID=412384 RepID=UPI0027DF4115|nr:tyrosine-type recombinase/integrase [Priestia aryabhattai]
MRYLKEDNLRHSPKSINHYVKVLKYFCDYLEEKFNYLQVDDTICTMDGAAIGKYLVGLKKEGLQPSTIRNRDAVIKGFFEWLTTEKAGKVREDSGYINGSYKSPKPDKRLPKYLTLYEVVNFIKNLYSESQRCMIHFLFDSGLRVSELTRVKKSDIPRLQDFPEDTMYFSLPVRGSKGRGGNIKPRETFISRSMIQRINRLHKQDKVYRQAYLFYGNDMPCFLNVKGKELTENAVHNLLYKAAKRLGVSTSKYSSHKYRHGFAISILTSEFDEDFVNKLVITKEALGHNDIGTTQIYTLISPAALKNLQNLNKTNDIFNRYEEAQKIYEETYLPQKKHVEKRGRGKGGKTNSQRNNS